MLSGFLLELDSELLERARARALLIFTTPISVVGPVLIPLVSGEYYCCEVSIC